METERKNPKKRVVFIIKCLVAGVLAFFIAAVSISMISLVAEGDGLSDAELTNWCERSYYEKDYAELYETIALFDLYGDRFAVYREVADAYMIYTEYIQWSRAAENGSQDANERALQKLSELERCVEECEFERNLKILDEFLQKAQLIGEK